MVNNNPWKFIPTLYFAEGVPYVLINSVSVLLYKRMGIDNVTLAFATSWLYLFWSLKMFWGLMIDTNSTKRTWIVYTEFLMSIVFLGIGLVLHLQAFFYVTLMIFFIGAFISASHDIAADGFYLLALDDENQAKFVGIRSTFYRLATILGSGLIVWGAGQLEISTKNVALSWSIAFVFAALLYSLISVYHKIVLPKPHTDLSKVKDNISMRKVFESYFKQPKIGVILAFIFLYRFGEGFISKMNQPFFLDSLEAGGLGMTTSQVGIVYGTIGVFCLLLGGVVGGIIIKKYGLKNCLWPMAVIINIPMYVYIIMSQFRTNIYLTSSMVAFEQFAYGFGFTAYMVYLMYLANKSEYKTTYYAISTSLMAIGMMIPGFMSGYLQALVGYKNFFILTAILGIPGILTIFYIPIENETKL